VVPIEYEAQGDENAIGFSVHFNPAHLSLSAAPALVIGSNGLPSNSTLFTNPAPIPPSPATGRLGINIGLPFTVPMSAGTRQLMTLTFNVLPAARCGVVSPVAIMDGPPTPLSLSDPLGNPLPNPNPVSGNVTITGPVITLSPPSLPGGIIGAPYSQMISATGGAAPHAFTLMAGTLPAGITLSTEGLLAGAPTQIGTFNGLMVKATDANGCAGVATYSLVIGCPTITLSPSSLPGAVVGTPYSQMIVPSPAGTYTFAVTAGALPPGLSLNASTGVLAGTPTSATGSPFSFTITATGAGPCSGSRAYTLAVTCPAIALTPAAGSLPAGTQGIAYSQNFSASGGTSPYMFSVTAGSLPGGLTLLPTGSLTGTPTTPGNFSFTVTATDANGCTGTAAYTLTINCPTITLNPPSLPNATVTQPYTQTITGSGGTAPYSFALGAGSALPTGLTLATDGTLSGAPLVPGTFSFTIVATDANNCTGSKLYSLQIGCPTITLNPATLPGGTAGTAYSQTLTATPAGGNYSFAVTAGSLPAGLTLTAAGLLSGTPTAAGTFNFTVTATGFVNGQNNCTGSRAYSLVIACPTITVNPEALPGGTVGAAYNQSVSAAPAVTTYSFAVTAGALPAGLTLNGGTGAITGTPTIAGTFTFTITATGFGSCTGSRQYTVQVVCPTIALSPSTLPGGTAGTAYSQTLTATPAGGNYTFAVTTGSLPAGLTLTAAGVLSGTPATAGTFNFTVTATGFVSGSNNCTGSQAYSLVIACPTITVSPTTLPGGTVGAAYNQTVSAAPTGTTYSFAVTAGALPTGLTLSGAGAITGTPTVAGSFTFTITATGFGACTGSRQYTVQIVCPTITLSPSPLPGGTAGTAYSQTLTASPAGGNYTFAVTTGTLPAGLTLTSAGVLSGTPTTAGTFNFTVTATGFVSGQNSCAGSQAYSLVIACPTITVNPATLPGGTVGAAYSQSVSAAPTGTTYSFAVTAGALPAGLALNAGTGAVTGTPAVAGSFTFTITATGFGACTGSRQYTVQIVCPTIALSPNTLPGGTAGTAYSQTLTASPAGGNYTFAVTTGALPAGLTLTSAGVLAGAPTTAGTFNFTVTATGFVSGSNNCAGSQAYSLVIACPTITVNPATLPGGTVGAAYSQTVSAAPTGTTYSFAVTTGALPNGLTLNAGTGAITGTPAVAGSFTFTITATGFGACTGSRQYTVQIVCPTIALSPSTLPSGTGGTAYSQTLTASPAGGNYTFAVTTGSLPAGLTLTSAGILSGTPMAVGTFNFTVTATGFVSGSNNCAGSQAYSLVIACPTISVSPETLPGGTAGTAYSQTLTANPTGGNYTFARTAGTLPTGLTLSSAGVLSGTPTAAGTFNFTVTATGFVNGQNNCAGSRAYSITVVCPAITTNPATLPGGTINASYSQTLTATGGTAPYSFAVTSGNLPASLTLTAAGVLSGTPPAAGSFNFTITATDANQCTGSRAYTLVISACLPITINPATIPPALRGAAYSQTFTQTGGIGTVTFSLTGSLPAGLTFANGVLSGIATQTGSFNFTVGVTDGNNCTGSRAYTLVVDTASLRLAEPAVCRGPGDVVDVTAQVTNNGTAPQTLSLTASLPPQLLGLPGTCTVNVGACAVGATTVTWNGTLAPGQTVTINYKAQVADGTPVNTQVCVNSTISAGGATAGTLQACTTISCAALGPGTLPSAASPVSDQKAGSVLVFNLYSSNAASPNTQNTRFSLTNIHPSQSANVHLFFVDGAACSVADLYICLTPNQTTSFLASDIDPGTTGYLVAVAKNKDGCPINFNYLIGDEYVKLSSGHAANLGAEAFSALAGGLPACNADSTTAVLNFDGVSYNLAPRVLAVDSIGSRADGNDTLLVVNRLGGNMATGAQTLTSLFGLLYDDTEIGYSFTFTPGTCQVRGSITNSFPRTTPRVDSVIPAGRAGWMRLWSQTDAALLGAAINFNSNAGVSSGAFNQGHNLHKLTLTGVASLTVPVFPPNC
jgi:hypothetical protein